MKVTDASSGSGKWYYYEKNLRGDIVGIMNADGYKVVSYSYDAWGVPYAPVYSTDSVVSAADKANAELNPFRYRGYYYDSETGYYYLQTRYYNPEWGRFINADGYINANGDILGYNMFAYCSNNPINNVDPTGEAIAISTIILGVAALYLLTCVAVELANDFSRSIAEAPPTIPDILVRPADSTLADRIDKTKEKEAEKEKEIEIATPSQNKTVIYRYHATKTKNLWPRSGIDFDGVSFSTHYRPGVKAVATTIEDVNASGILYAFETGNGHVLVVPTNGTVKQWMYEGKNAIWSKRLSSIVYEINGKQ